MSEATELKMFVAMRLQLLYMDCRDANDMIAERNNIAIRFAQSVVAATIDEFFERKAAS